MIPTVISLIQLLLSFFVYKRDTPKHLCEIGNDDDCIEELAKIYSSADRRLFEYGLIKKIINQKERQYPTYRELLGPIHWKSTRNGILLLMLHNCNGLLLMLTFATIIFNSIGQIGRASCRERVYVLV